ncbi:MAG: SDR family oxidoreductase [bacterium]
MAPVDFRGRVAVVTGAGGGLGKSYALELARRGAKVVVNDFGGSRDGTGGGTGMADKVVEEIRAAGGEAVANYDGVHTYEGGETIVRQAVATFGKVDILINNAGILRDKSFTKMEKEAWYPVLEVHLQGAYHVTRPAFTSMREKGYGRVVMTTSGAGLFGNFGQTNYSAAKLGLIGLMKSLAIEGAKYNIKVNAIAPVAATRMTEDITPPEVFQKLSPEFVMPAVLFLCSESCQESGRILCAGAGLVQNASVVINEGVFLGKQPPTVEDIQENWKRIVEPKSLKEIPNVMESIGDIMKHYQ